MAMANLPSSGESLKLMKASCSIPSTSARNREREENQIKVSPYFCSQHILKVTEMWSMLRFTSWNNNVVVFSASCLNKPLVFDGLQLIWDGQSTQSTTLETHNIRGLGFLKRYFKRMRSTANETHTLVLRALWQIFLRFPRLKIMFPLAVINSDVQEWTSWNWDGWEITRL